MRISDPIIKYIYTIIKNRSYCLCVFIDCQTLTEENIADDIEFVMLIDILQASEGVYDK